MSYSQSMTLLTLAAALITQFHKQQKSISWEYEEKVIHN